MDVADGSRRLTVNLQTMTETFPSTVDQFRKSAKAAVQLADLDRGLIDYAIKQIEERDDRLRKAGVDSHRMLCGNIIQNLRNIRENDSLRPGFQALVDQTVVLLASYFSSAVGQLFRLGVRAALGGSPSKHLQELSMKLTVVEIATLGGDLVALADLVARTHGISFQDTKSIQRTFKDFFDVDVPRDGITHDVGAGLAFRHALVHNGGVVDQSCLRQIEALSPRSFKPKAALEEVVHFDTAEVKALAGSMQAYVERIGAGMLQLMSA